MSRRITITQTAESTPFDGENSPVSGENVKEALEDVYGLAFPLVTTINITQNGTLSNGDWLGYSNLLPGDDTPIVIPITGTLVGLTWSNRRNTADFALEFRLNSTTNPIFYTYTTTNTQTDNIVLPTPEPVTEGDTIFIQYIDQGKNAADANIVLRFKA